MRRASDAVLGQAATFGLKAFTSVCRPLCDGLHGAIKGLGVSPNGKYGREEELSSSTAAIGGGIYLGSRICFR